MTEDEVAALRGPGAATAKFADPQPSAAYANLWPRARWQVAGGRSALPAAAAGALGAYGVTQRLQARWREVHEVSGGVW